MRFTFDTDAYQRNTQEAQKLWNEIEEVLKRVGDSALAKSCIESSIAELEPDYRPLAEALSEKWLKGEAESDPDASNVSEENLKRTFKDNIRSIFELFRFGNFVRFKSEESMP